MSNDTEEAMEHYGGEPSHDWAEGYRAGEQAALERAVESSDAITGVLTVHYVTAIDCDHDAKTDTIRCNCSVWTGTPQPSVGDAVQEWIAHVLERLAATSSPTVAGERASGREDYCFVCGGQHREAECPQKEPKA